MAVSNVYQFCTELLHIIFYILSHCYSTTYIFATVTFYNCYLLLCFKKNLQKLHSVLFFLFSKQAAYKQVCCKKELHLGLFLSGLMFARQSKKVLLPCMHTFKLRIRMRSFHIRYVGLAWQECLLCQPRECELKVAISCHMQCKVFFKRTSVTVLAYTSLGGHSQLFSFKEQR